MRARRGPDFRERGFPLNKEKKAFLPRANPKMWRVDSVRQSGESVAQQFVKIKSKLFPGPHFFGESWVWGFQLQLRGEIGGMCAYIRRLADVHARIHAYAAVAGLGWDGCPVTPVHRATLSWGNAFDRAARGSTPLRFSSQTTLSLSPRCMPAGDAAETSTTSTTSTRWRFPGGPSHNRAQGVPLIRSGIPLSLTFSPPVRG